MMIDDDIVDCLVLIKSLLMENNQTNLIEKENNHVSLSTYLQRVIECEDKITSATEDSPLSEEYLENVKSIVHESRQYFDDKVFSIMDQQTWGIMVPKPLLITNVPGVINLIEYNPLPQSTASSTKTSTTNGESDSKKPFTTKKPSCFLVRGQNYLKDGKKIASPKPLFFTRGMQVVSKSSFCKHVAQESWCAFPKHPHNNNEWLILNYMVPGASCVHVVCFFSASKEALHIIRGATTSHTATTTATTTSTTYSTTTTTTTSSPGAKGQKGPPPTSDHSKASSTSSSSKGWKLLVQQFWNANKDFCDSRFKMIPQIIEGNWAIKMAVGSKPALTGKKLIQSYYRGKGYFEIDIDISASPIATGILSLVRGVSKHLVVDIGVTIQGEEEEELPEVVLCQNRFEYVDLDAAAPIE
mmetsp:Transcript_28615/g.40779  ORF Transcript_28615/g.40779 Transcript_28615/m.40779 type:complete len:413 (+) Transcript_28615:40-1278(+)